MVLAAGHGKRLAPLTNHTPKPLLPVGGEPLVHKILTKLKNAEVTDVVINTHHLADQIETALGNGSLFDLQIRYSRETKLLETGGGIKAALPLLEDNQFIVCNGDIYTDFDFADLPDQLNPGDLAHLVLVPTPPNRNRGDFDFANGRIPSKGDSYVYSGIAIIHHDLFNQSPNGAFSLRDLLFGAVSRDQISAQLHYGNWTDIGTPQDYAEANRSALGR